MKKLLLLFNLIAVFPSLGFADPCDYNRINELLRGGDARFSKPRSTWGSSEEIRRLNSDRFRWFRFIHSEYPMVKVRKGALGQLKPELMDILDDMNFYQMTTRRFEDEYLLANSRMPKLGEYQDFYNSRLNVYTKGFDQFVEVLASVDESLAQQVRGRYLDQAGLRLGLKTHFVEAKSVEEIDRTASEMYRWMSGTFAELYATVALPNVREVNVVLGDPGSFHDVIELKIKEAFADFTSLAEAIGYYEELYPKVFKNGRIARLHESERKPDRIVKELKRWIYDKEIDVVRFENGKRIFVEVKHNRDLFSVGDFRSVHGSKSYEDQILEDKQLIEFLGLSDKIEIEYLMTGGMSSSLKEELKKLGIKVLEAH